MKLFMNGITRNTNSAVLILELKRAGYVEVKEPEAIPAQKEEVIAPEEPDEAPLEKDVVVKHKKAGK